MPTSSQFGENASCDLLPYRKPKSQSAIKGGLEEQPCGYGLITAKLLWKGDRVVALALEDLCRRKFAADWEAGLANDPEGTNA